METKIFLRVLILALIRRKFSTNGTGGVRGTEPAIVMVDSRAYNSDG